MPVFATRSTSILGEALHAGLARLHLRLQQEFTFTAALAAHKLADTFGFANWNEMCERAIAATSHSLDFRLAVLVVDHLDGELANRLAHAFDTSASRMRDVLTDFRHPDRMLVCE